jgi:hypothetical protein
LPCLDVYYASCGHIGTGALGPGYAAGFVYVSPPVAGLKLQAGLYDPVRLLGAWERVPLPRPEGRLSYEHALSPTALFNVSVEGMYQLMTGCPTCLAVGRTDRVWGLAAGGRLEIGAFRLGASYFRGKGLGVYVALQNSSTSFDNTSYELRYFTGIYAQSALVLGRFQISLGGGRVTDDQLASDKRNASSSELKSQTGGSLGVYYTLTSNLVLGLDYFRFQADWWGAPNSTYVLDANNNPVVTIGQGVLRPEKQVMNFINAGATLHW